MKRNSKDYFVISLKGVAMGAADVVPGVSGGTIAFISGIYEELIGSINKVNLNSLRVLKTNGFQAFWKEVNGSFLLSLLIGIGLSIVTLARVIKYLMENQAILLWSFFFGLVLASIIYVGKQVKRWNLGIILSMVVGAIGAYFITTLTPQTADAGYGYIFLSGALAICAMILPGISGSFILLLLGMYKPLLEALNNRDLVFLGVLIIGAVAGLLSFSRLLKWLFDRFEQLTLAVLTGFIIGSLNKIWPWKEVLKSEMINGKLKILDEQSVSPMAYDGNAQIVGALICAVCGFVFILLLERFADKKEA